VIVRLGESGVKAESLTRLADGTWDVDLDGWAIRDLSILHGALISRLSLGETGVSDLSALAGMPLKRLMLWRAKVSDLSPLKGMPLEELILVDTRVTDLSPLAGMKLRMLHLNTTEVTDISVVRGMPLTSVRLTGCKRLMDVSPLRDATELIELTLPPGAKEIEFLRALPKLAFIGFGNAQGGPDRPAAEFWRGYDAKKE
jgi:hypothetical protein